MFSIPRIMDQFIKKYQQDVTSQYFISCFVTLGYMLRTGSVAVGCGLGCVRTESAKTTAGRTILLPYQRLHMQSIYWSPDDGHGTCPKHVEKSDKTGNKVLWRDILLVFLDESWFIILS
jgi:hypothetical protein